MDEICINTRYGTHKVYIIRHFISNFQQIWGENNDFNTLCKLEDNIKMDLLKTGEAVD